MNLAELRASEKAAVTVTDVARLLDIDERTVRRACEDGALHCIRLGRRLLIPREPLLALLSASPEMSEDRAPTRSTAATEPAEGAHNHGDTDRLRSA